MFRFFVLFAAALLTACGGHDAAPPPPPAPPQQTTFSPSGQIIAAAGMVADGDVNDPDAPYTANDSPSTAQVLPNPSTLGGYVNVAGAGAAGRSKQNGDEADGYRISAVAGQVVSMIVSDPDAGDPDLYLYDATGSTVIDASLGTGTYEQIIIPETGDYQVVVIAADGASSYVLTVGPCGACDQSVSDNHSRRRQAFHA